MLSKKTHPQGRIRWNDDVISKVKERILAFYQQEIASTVRGMFYILVSLNIIANAIQNYKGLDRATVITRKNCILPENCFVDNSSRIIDIDITPVHYSSQDIATDIVTHSL